MQVRRKKEKKKENRLRVYLLLVNFCKKQNSRCLLSLNFAIRVTRKLTTIR